MLKRLLTASALALAFAGPALAAVTPNNFVTVQTPASAIGNSTTSPIVLFTAGLNGAKCNGMTISTNSTNAVTVFIEVSISSAATLATVLVPAAAGSAVGVPAVAPMSSTYWPGLPLDSEGNPYLLLPAGSAITISFSGQSSTAAVEALISCGNF